MGMPRTLAHCIGQVMRLGVSRRAGKSARSWRSMARLWVWEAVTGQWLFLVKAKKSNFCLNLEVDCSRGVSISLPNRWDGYGRGIRLTTLTEKNGYHRAHPRIRLRHAERQKTSKNIKKHQKTSKNIKKHQKTSKNIRKYFRVGIRLSPENPLGRPTKNPHSLPTMNRPSSSGKNEKQLLRHPARWRVGVIANGLAFQRCAKRWKL